MNTESLKDVISWLARAIGISEPCLDIPSSKSINSVVAVADPVSFIPPVIHKYLLEATILAAYALPSNILVIRVVEVPSMA